MSDIRLNFEEIWPVPDVIMWSEYIGRYIPMPDEVLQYERLNEQWAHEHNARLDTFTRCQETTAIYSGIVDDMIREMELINSVSTDLRAVGIAREAIGRAKQKMGMMK